MTPPPGGWTVPPPPPGNRPIRGWRVTGGIAIAFVGHLITVALAVPALTGSGNQSMNWVVAALVVQAVLFVACLTIGIVLMVRNDRGLGLGLIIGWALGIIVLPVIGFGACVVALRSMGSG